MKTLANRIAQLAAGVVVLGSMAYGQSAMKADIPFTFHTANATLPASIYTLLEDRHNGMATVQLWNQAAHRSVLTSAGPVDWYSRGKASVTFLCTDGNCSLSRVRTSEGTVSYLPPHKSRRDKSVAAVVTIPMTAVHGD